MIHSYIKYTSIRSIVEDIHSMVDSVDWDEGNVLEWATKGLRKLNIPAKYEDTIVILNVKDHSAQLPCDIKYINQIFYKQTVNKNDYKNSIEYIQTNILGIDDYNTSINIMEDNYGLSEKILNSNHFFKYFKPLRRSSNVFGVSPCSQEKVYSKACPHTYTLYSKEAIQTSFKNGCVIISYKRYVKDNEGLDLVPENEDLKDALFHFVMYRWWMSRMSMKEEGSERQMLFHQQQYKELGRKASANLNSPDIDTLENIKNYRDRLIPKSNMYDSAFSRLSNRENLDF